MSAFLYRLTFGLLLFVASVSTMPLASNDVAVIDEPTSFLISEVITGDYDTSRTLKGYKQKNNASQKKTKKPKSQRKGYTAKSKRHSKKPKSQRGIKKTKSPVYCRETKAQKAGKKGSGKQASGKRLLEARRLKKARGAGGGPKKSAKKTKLPKSKRIPKCAPGSSPNGQPQHHSPPQPPQKSPMSLFPSFKPTTAAPVTRRPSYPHCTMFNWSPCKFYGPDWQCVDAGTFRHCAKPCDPTQPNICANDPNLDASFYCSTAYGYCVQDCVGGSNGFCPASDKFRTKCLGGVCV